MVCPFKYAALVEYFWIFELVIALKAIADSKSLAVDAANGMIGIDQMLSLVPYDVMQITGVAAVVVYEHDAVSRHQNVLFVPADSIACTKGTPYGAIGVVEGDMKTFGIGGLLLRLGVLVYYRCL